MLTYDTIYDKINNEIPRINSKNINILLIGANNTGNTSISFNIADNIALHRGSLLYICNQTKIER